MNEENAMQKQTEGFGTKGGEKSVELSAIAVAASAKAEVEASYIMALKKPRNEGDARLKILNVCKNPSFAEKAIYKKPIGEKILQGPSIRFAEESLRHWGNVKVLQSATYDDETKRIIKITVIDLETNLSFSKEITIEKHVERKSRAGRVVVNERQNTKGQTVYIVEATEDELQNKESAHASKVIRNNGLRLIPEYIIEEAMQNAYDSIKTKINKDPEAEKRKIFDAFNLLGIKPSHIEKYLKHPISQIVPGELVDLRNIYTAIKEGAARWTDYVPAEITSDIEMPKAKSPKKKEAKKEEVVAEGGQPANQKQKDQMRKLAVIAGIEKDGDYLDFLATQGIKDPDKMNVLGYQTALKKLGNMIDEQAKKKTS